MSSDKVPFVFPSIRPGDTVYHCPDGKRSARPFPAIVLRVSPRTADLWQVGGGILEAVRYIEDPDLTRDQIEDFGCWDISDNTKRIEFLEAEVKRLSEIVDSIKAPRARPADNIQGRNS